MLIAQHRAVVETNSARVRNLSLSAALRLIKGQNPTALESRQNKAKNKAALSSTAWSEATFEERRRFLDKVGHGSVREAQPPAWHKLDDIGPNSAGEIARKLARLDELVAETARLKRENLALKSEVEELNAGVLAQLSLSELGKALECSAP